MRLKLHPVVCLSCFKAQSVQQLLFLFEWRKSGVKGGGVKSESFHHKTKRNAFVHRKIISFQLNSFIVSQTFFFAFSIPLHSPISFAPGKKTQAARRD